MRINDREYNRLRALRALRRSEPIGRTDLALACGLDGATITEISANLLQRNLITETKVQTGKRGRPQRHLELNPDGARAFAAYIGIAGQLVCEVVNLRGESLYLASDPMGEIGTIEAWSHAISAIINANIAASGFDKKSLAHIGIALPAVVDSENGIIHWVQTFESAPYRAAEHIEQEVGIPVTIDNNTNVLARAEHWFGDHTKSESFSIFNIGYGISAAHYSAGVLYAGSHGLNSEIGHSKIVLENGRLCPCGAFGCLTSYCSITGLIEQACEATHAGTPPLDCMAATLGKFVSEAQQGRAELQPIFERAGRYLGIAVANHINSFDPGRVILLCEHPDLEAIFANSRGVIEDNCLPPMRGTTSVEFRFFEQDLFRKGAAALVLENLYKSL